MELSIYAEPIFVRPARNGFIVTNISEDCVVKEDYVFTSLEELVTFIKDKYIEKPSNWDNKKPSAGETYGGGS